MPSLTVVRHPQEDSDSWRERAPWLRDEVERLLKADVDPTNPVGVNQHGACGGTAPSRHAQRGTAEDFTARLKRDDPELAARVVNGKITPNAAARAKGWRKPRIVVSTEVPKNVEPLHNSPAVARWPGAASIIRNE
ncbi:MAG: hypothetical protein ACRDRO_11650 [Pseudonocardiaceae bacterium]